MDSTIVEGGIVIMVISMMLDKLLPYIAKKRNGNHNSAVAKNRGDTAR